MIYAEIFMQLTLFYLISFLPISLFFNNLLSIKLYCELPEEYEQVQQANLFKCISLVFHFQHIIHDVRSNICLQSDRMRKSTAKIIAAVVEMTGRPL